MAGRRLFELFKENVTVCVLNKVVMKRMQLYPEELKEEGCEICRLNHFFHAATFRQSQFHQMLSGVIPEFQEMLC